LMRRWSGPQRIVLASRQIRQSRFIASFGCYPIRERFHLAPLAWGLYNLTLWNLLGRLAVRQGPQSELAEGRGTPIDYHF
jgi:hypothetical protein